MKNLIIADPHTLCLEALCNFIRNAEESVYVESFQSYAALKAHAQSASADLVLIDKGLLGVDPKEMIQDFGHMKIGIMVAPHEGLSDIENIQGVFPKSLSCKAFLSGIESILGGKPFFPQADFHEANISTMTSGFTKVKQDFHLTEREKEVLSYLVKGASNKDIARALDLQVVTIKLHVRGICRKLKASNRTQAALIATENGWG